MKFRDNLLYLRQQRNMTQEQLAMLLGVSRQSVAKWEAGQSTPEVDKLMKMSELFGCSLDELVSGDVTLRTVDPAEILPADAPPQDVCGYDEHVHKFAKFVSLGVGVIILGITVTVLLDALGFDDLSVIGVLTGVVAGLACIIPAGVEHAAFTKAHPFVEDFYTEDQKARYRSLFSRGLVLGIGLILAGVIFAAVFESGGISDDVSASVLLLLVAVGVALIVYVGILFGLTDVDNYNEERANEKWEREHPLVNKICAIIMLVATIVGLLLLFGGISMAGNYETLPFAMKFFWLPWPIGGIMCAIVTAAMRPNNR